MLADMSGMRGITEYQPQEYTLTVRAGTRVSEIQAALHTEGQYLPFDPLFAESRKHRRYRRLQPVRITAASLRRHTRLYLGRWAGRRTRTGFFTLAERWSRTQPAFDLSKFLVGSLGQYAIMTELTFKVFPDRAGLSRAALASTKRWKMS